MTTLFCRRMALALICLLSFGILTIWVPARWPLGVFQGGAYILGAIVLLRLTKPGAELRWSPVFVVPVLVVMWGLFQLSAHTTVYAWETTLALLTWTANASLAFVAVQVLADRAGLRTFLGGVLYFGFALSVLSTLQMFTSEGSIFWIFPSKYSDFVLGPFVYRNHYAAFIELTAPVALYFSFQDSSRSRLYAVMAGCMFASVVAGASRAGSALVVAEIVAVFIIAAVGKQATQAMILRRLGQLAATASLLALVVGVDVLWSRFQADDPFSGRREFLLSSLEMVRERPGVGFGLGTWASTYPAYALYDDGTLPIKRTMTGLNGRSRAVYPWLRHWR
jgi:hypothetical protein